MKPQISLPVELPRDIFGNTDQLVVCLERVNQSRGVFHKYFQTPCSHKRLPVSSD